MRAMSRVKLPGLLIAVACLISACAGQPAHERQIRADIHDTLNQSAQAHQAAPQTPPAAVNQALLPPAGGALPGMHSAREERFDVSVRNMDARDFFMGLVKDTPYNMVVHPDVKGTISLSLKNVTVPEVMQTVQDAFGYDYQRTSTGFLVLPAALQTRIFQVNYLDFTREGSSRTRVSSGQVTDAPTTGAYGAGAGAGAQPYNTGQQGGTGQTENATKIETKVNSDFWAELKSTLTAIVGDKDGRSVVVNKESGVVVVRAMPSELRDVKQYLATIQGNSQRQVILEAKIVEVVLNNGFQSGINWGALGRPGSGKTIFGGQVGGQGLFDNGASTLQSLPLTIGPGNPVSSLPSTGFGGTFALSLNLNDFNAFIELLDTQGDTHVLSSPRVATLNNQQAVIKVGSDEFFVTGVTSNTVTSTATSTNRNVVLTPFFSGIALDVTPQIDEHGDVILHIHPTVSKVIDQRKDLTIAGEKTDLPLAYSQVRESDSVVRAKSGQIIVIGGLMKNQTEDITDSTPILGDIPLLGELFKQKRQKHVKTELVILLKPIVVDSDQAWRDAAKTNLKDFQDMEGGGK